MNILGCKQISDYTRLRHQFLTSSGWFELYCMKILLSIFFEMLCEFYLITIQFIPLKFFPLEFQIQTVCLCNFYIQVADNFWLSRTIRTLWSSLQNATVIFRRYCSQSLLQETLSFSKYWIFICIVCLIFSQSLQLQGRLTSKCKFCQSDCIVLQSIRDHLTRCKFI